MSIFSKLKNRIQKKSNKDNALEEEQKLTESYEATLAEVNEKMNQEELKAEFDKAKAIIMESITTGKPIDAYMAAHYRATMELYQPGSTMTKDYKPVISTKVGNSTNIYYADGTLKELKAGSSYAQDIPRIGTKPDFYNFSNDPENNKASLSSDTELAMFLAVAPCDQLSALSGDIQTAIESKKSKLKEYAMQNEIKSNEEYKTYKDNQVSLNHLSGYAKTLSDSANNLINNEFNLDI